MKWFKERYEACMVIIGILTIMGMCMGWMSSQFSNMNDKFDTRFNHLENRLTAIEKDVDYICHCLLKFNNEKNTSLQQMPSSSKN